MQHELLLSVLKDEVQPALGCTGPIVFSYVAAEARDAVGGIPRRIIIKADKDKCAKENDVGIPGTQYLGVKMAAALGAFAGDPKAKLEVLHSVTPNMEQAAYEFCISGNVVLEPDWETPLIGIYVDITVETDKGVGRAIVVKTHTNLVHKSANGKVIFEKPFNRLESIKEEKNDFISNCKISDMYDFALNIPVEELTFLYESVSMNIKLAEVVLNGELGPTYALSMLSRGREDMIQRAKALTAAAAEARMVGYNLPAMSCATSGNVGITASLPIISVAETLGKKEEDILRALAFSFLLTILGKNRIGRQSAMCACMVTASLGVAGAVTMLLGGNLKQIEMSINNTIVNVFGVVCDGARRACALKLSSAVGIALEGALLAMDGITTNSGEGVCRNSADESIDFMGRHAKEGMLESDMILCKLLLGEQ
jgi:L-cysteine desulfidase